MAAFVILHHFSDFSSGLCVFWIILAVESLWVLANLDIPHMSTEVAARQELGLLKFLFWWSSVSHSQFRSENLAIIVRMLGCSPDTTNYTALCVLLLRYILSFLFDHSGKWHVCCIGSNLTSLCGMVRFATALTGWINSFWFSVCSVTVFLCCCSSCFSWEKRCWRHRFRFQDCFVFFSASFLCFFLNKRHWFP